MRKIERLAGLDEKFKIRGTLFSQYGRREEWSSTLTWSEIFALIGPYLLKIPTDEYIKIVLKDRLLDRGKPEGRSYEINDQDFQTVALQLKALGLININYSKTTDGRMALFLSLTKAGEQMMMELRTVPPAK